MEKPKILVVDDEEVVRDLFQRGLNKEEYEVQTADSGESALMRMEQGSFNLLIVDLKMPRIEGLELLKRIKQSNPYIEVIIITGYETTASAVEAMKNGAYDYIAKPLNLEELQLLIRRCIEKQKLAIENIELKELVAFFEVSKTIAFTRDLDKLLAQILDSALQVTKAKRGSLLLLDESTNKLGIKLVRGFRKDVVEDTKINIGEGISGWVAKEAKPLLVVDIETDFRFRRKNQEEYETKSFISVPLASVPFVLEGKVLGVVNVSDKISGEIFTDRDLTLLSVLASQGAIAIENAKLYGELQNKIDELKNTIEKLNQTQAQLVQSEKLASVGTLAAGIAHEIGNPLNVISGRAKLLLMDLDKDSAMAKSLNTIVEQVDKAARITDNLLEFAKPTEPKTAPLDVNEVLKETISLVENRILLKNIKIDKDLSSNLPYTSADFHQLQQVFLNMILNAEQAMPQGGRLTITTLHKGEFVQVEFADTGCGIPEENIPKIFDPFFTTRQNGKGLGLSVSYGIIKAHQGSIEVASKLGEGSHFIIKLPVAQEANC